jgi:hypothetical protein
MLANLPTMSKELIGIGEKMELDPGQRNMSIEEFEVDLRGLLNLYMDLAEEEAEGVIKKIADLVPPPNRRAFINNRLIQGAMDLIDQPKG